MTITLRIANDAGRVYGAELQKVFAEEGGVIGRAPGNDWVLPDPKKYVSSRHAAIYFKDGAWYLADISANGVYVNGASEPVGSEQPVQLHDGDSLQLGDYELEVHLAQPGAVAPPPGPAVRATPTPPPEFQPGASIPETLDPLELLAGGAFDKPALETPSPAQEPIPGGHATGPIGPMELNPMAPPAQPFLKDIPGPADRGAHPDDVAVLSSGFRPPDAGPEQIPEDWDLLATPQPPAAASQPTPIPEPPVPPPRAPEPPVPPPRAPEPAPAAVPTPGPNAPPAPAVQTPAPPPAAPVPTTTASDAMLRAFFEGAGLDPAECLANADPELPRLVGEIFREVVAGMRAVLVARAHLKSGFRMNVTMIQQRENNPLKFAAGGTDEAMRHLLFHSGSSYLPPLEAVREGFDDLKKHQLALVTGMKAALLSVLQRFDPEKLAEEFEQQAKSGSMLSNKRARYWALYAEYYQQLMTEVEDDFSDTIGRIFAKSYEEQIDRLSAAGNDNDAGD